MYITQTGCNRQEARSTTLAITVPACLGLLASDLARTSTAKCWRLVGRRLDSCRRRPHRAMAPPPHFFVLAQ